MRHPVKRVNVKSLVVCAALIFAIPLVEIVLAYALTPDFSFEFGAVEGVERQESDSAEDDPYADIGVEIDSDAVKGMIDPTQKTGTPKKYGDIAYKISPNPEFKTGTAAGKVMIENHGDNLHLIKVRFETADGELIYQSGFIAPDMHIPSAKLDVELADGTYDVTAIIEAYDMDTQEYIGKLEQPITVKVGK